ncbi:hypothetical protein V7V80_06720 [Pseudomonas kermanshahensis]|uniref:Uncharacterized protein n=1 Tax=Pseudomonas kermanshahensis TaxID=2745482 RepID=A0ABU8R3M0_9PSED
MAWKDSQIGAARKGWNLVLSVHRQNVDDITDIVKEMKSGSFLNLSFIAAIDDGGYASSAEFGLRPTKDLNALTTEEFNRFCDAIPSGINVTLSLPS